MLTIEDPRVGLIGDLHGNTRWGIHCLNHLADRGIENAFVLGDFGIWGSRSGEEFLTELDRALFENGSQKLYVVLGNHENYDLIDSWFSRKDLDSDDIFWVREHIAILPRVFRLKIGDKEVLTLGGAPSIDFEYRIPGVSWWPQEQITSAQAEEAISGGYADIMLTHDAPQDATPGVAYILRNNPMGWSERALAYAAEGRHIMTQVVSAVKPRYLMHGHYHVASEGFFGLAADYHTHCWSFDCDGQDKSCAVLDTTDPDGLEFII